MEKERSKEKARCLSCGGALRELAFFENMPSSAQDLPDKEGLAQDKPIALRLCQCLRCGLVQLDTEPVSYYKDVIRAGGGSSTMRALRHAEYGRLLSALSGQGLARPKIIEVGCGRGEFLSMWADLQVPPADNAAAGADGCGENAETSKGGGQGFAVYGMEHSAALAAEARAQGLQVFEGFAEGGCAFPNAPYDAFVQFNFLEHQPRPRDMLRTIRRNLREGGLGLVTVPDFSYILRYDGYYELLRDHIANYTEGSLQVLFRACGFRVLDSRIVNRDTIEILVQKEAMRPELPAEEPGGGEVFSSEGMFSQSLLLSQQGSGTGAEAGDVVLAGASRLRENHERLKEAVHALLDALEEKGERLAIWGASHQGFTLASSTGLSGRVRYIIDSAPFKQGKYAPASHIPIVSPEHFFEDPVELILIVAPGYTEEIAGIIRSCYGGSVRLLTLRSEKITALEEGGCGQAL